jgi:triosephosphate isomerase
MRIKIAAGNWKMNNDLNEGKKLAEDIVLHINSDVSLNNNTGHYRIVLSPPAFLLSPCYKIIQGNESIKLAGQNCYYEDKGAFTGEISAKMIRSTGADYCLVGHSERRQYFNETNEVLKRKVDAVLSNALTPIFCCGEKLEERNAGRHFTTVETQIRESLFHLNNDDLSKIVIAYEPVWAIGTGVNASAEQAQEMHKFIRDLIKSKYGNDISDNMTILYGGSCNSKNADELFSNPDVDGGLIGGASLKADEFISIIRSLVKSIK